MILKEEEEEEEEENTKQSHKRNSDVREVESTKIMSSGPNQRPMQFAYKDTSFLSFFVGGRGVKQAPVKNITFL